MDTETLQITHEPNAMMGMMAWINTDGGRRCLQCGRYSKSKDLGWIGHRSSNMIVDIYGHLPGKGCNKRKF